MSLVRYGLAISAAALMLSGCGGSSNSTVLPSLYEGSWNGSWNSPLAPDGGTLTFTVQADGSVAGTITRTGNLSGTFGGVINNTGKLTGTATFPSSGNFLITGQVLLSDSDLNGSFAYSWLGSEYQATFSETPQSASSGS